MDLQFKLKLLREDAEYNRIYECPVCQTGETKVLNHVFYGRCDNCGASLVDYIPLPHQDAFHQSNAQYKLQIGGFASGKTTASCVEIAIHALDIAYGRTLITAPTLTLVQDAVYPELMKIIPPWFIEKQRMRPSPYIRLTNGHEIIVYSSADQEKMRSLNLSAFYIEEASAVDYAIFDQLMTRLRHPGGIIRDERGKEIGYKYLGLISTNPEEFWGKDKFLFVSDKVFTSPSINGDVYKPMMFHKREEYFHSFISSSRDNHHKPDDFVRKISAGKSAEWVRVYIDCYLDRREGSVYPTFNQNFVEPFKIPMHWKRVAGFDPGYNDETAFVIGAIDPKDGCVYIYDDYYMRERGVSFHAKEIRKRVSQLSFYQPIQADPSVRKRNDRDGISYANYFYKISKIMLEPGNNDILYGIEKIRDYLFNGKLKFFNNCTNLKKEGSMYVYTKNKNTNSNDKPVDKNNHLMDALRYLVARLPRDPNEMSLVYVQSEQSMSRGAFLTSIEDDEDIGMEENVFGGITL